MEFGDIDGIRENVGGSNQGLKYIQMPY